jgi:hypothetical protein
MKDWLVINCGGSDAEERRSTSRGVSEPPLQKEELFNGKNLVNIEKNK